MFYKKKKWMKWNDIQIFDSWSFQALTNQNGHQLKKPENDRTGAFPLISSLVGGPILRTTQCIPRSTKTFDIPADIGEWNPRLVECHLEFCVFFFHILRISWKFYFYIFKKCMNSPLMKKAWLTLYPENTPHSLFHFWPIYSYLEESHIKLKSSGLIFLSSI